MFLWLKRSEKGESSAATAAIPEIAPDAPTTGVGSCKITPRMKESNKEEIKAAIKKTKAIFLFRLYILLLFQGKKDKTYFQIDVLNFRDRTRLQSKREVEFAPDDLKNIVELNVQEEKRSR